MANVIWMFLLALASKKPEMLKAKARKLTTPVVVSLKSKAAVLTFLTIWPANV